MRYSPVAMGLLWISFPEIRDGGIDLIYSHKRDKIVGTFLGVDRG